MLTYTLADLIDSRNRGLYESVAARATVVLRRAEGRAWNEERVGNEIRIGYAATPARQAAFAHELLHARLELDGLAKPQFIDAGAIGKSVIGSVMADLIHRKMIEPFLALGYPLSAFLSESDADLLPDLRRDVKRAERDSKLRRALITGVSPGVLYLTLTSPREVNEEERKLIKRFRLVVDPALTTSLDALITEWQSSASLDLRYPLAKFFKVCGWPPIGFSNLGTSEDLITPDSLLPTPTEASEE